MGQVSSPCCTWGHFPGSWGAWAPAGSCSTSPRRLCVLVWTSAGVSTDGRARGLRDRTREPSSEARCHTPSYLAMLLLLGEGGQSFSSPASVSPPGTQGQPTQPSREDFVALRCPCLREAVLALGAGRPDIVLRKRSAGDRAGPSGGLDLRWTRGSWLVTLGHSVLLPGLTHRRPPTSSRVCDASRARTQGREEPVAPRTRRMLAVGQAGVWPPPRGLCSSSLP